MSDIVEVKFISSGDIQSNTTIQRHVHASLIEPFIDVAQRIWILPVLSQRLYDSLSNDIALNGLTGITPANSALLTYIKPALIFGSAYESVPFLRAQITPKGFVTKSSDAQSVKASDKDVAGIKESWYHFAQTYVQDLKRFLRNNKATYLLWEEEYYATTEQYSGQTYSNSSTGYFSGIVFDKDANSNSKFKGFL